MPFVINSDNLSIKLNNLNINMSQIDLDYIKSIASLHSSEFLLRGEPSSIQLALEEAIKMKTGQNIDISQLIAPSIKQRTEDLKNISTIIEESKTTSSSDNELELDWLKEDLMCVICKGMDVGARNRLLECADCHSLYHQECHRPIVTLQETDTNWFCQTCKDLRKVDKTPPAATTAPITVTPEPTSNQTTVIETTYKNSVIKPVKRPASPVKPTMNKSLSNPTTTNNSRSNATPNMNMFHVEKKLQIMKKKAAAKQHEKRKLPR